MGVIGFLKRTLNRLNEFGQSPRVDAQTRFNSDRIRELMIVRDMHVVEHQIGIVAMIDKEIAHLKKEPNTIYEGV